MEKQPRMVSPIRAAEFILLSICLISSFILVYGSGCNRQSGLVLLTLGTDVVGMMTAVLIFFSLAMKRKSSAREEVLMAALIAEAVVLLFDIVSWYCNNDPGLWAMQVVGRYLKNIFLLFAVAAGWPFFRVNHRLSRHSAMIGDSIIIFLVVLALALLLTNDLTEFLFEVHRDGSYGRGSFLFVFYAMVTSVACIEAVYSACYNIGLRQKTMGVSAFLVFLLLVVIQYFRLGLSLIYIGPLITFVIIYANFYVTQTERLHAHDADIAEDKYKAMMTQIQPHFLYNSLTSLIRIPEMPEATREALFEYSSFLRETLDSTERSHPIPYWKELEHIENYLELEKIRLGGRLHYDIRGNDRNFPIPMLVLQLIIENSVLHGIAPKSTGGNIVISSETVEGGHLVTVTDDGVGFDTTAVSNRPGSGLDIVRKRLKESVGGTIVVKSSVGRGTRSEIYIPGYVQGGE